MIIAGEQYPAISIDQLVALLIRKKVSSETPLILDVRSEEEFAKGHIIGAEYYPRMLLSRERFETESMKKVGSQRPLLVCGEKYGAGQVVSTLCDRGYRAVMVKGNLDNWRLKYPEGLLTYSDSNFVTLDPSKLSAQLAVNRRPAFERSSFLKATTSSENRNNIRKKMDQKSQKDKRRAWR